MSLNKLKIYWIPEQGAIFCDAPHGKNPQWFFVYAGTQDRYECSGNTERQACIRASIDGGVKLTEAEAINAVNQGSFL